MRRVLVIAYFFPPLANSGTQRPVKFVNHLPDEGWQPVVLTVDDAWEPAVDPALLREVREGTEVHRVPYASDREARLLAWLAGPWRGRVEEGLRWRLRQRARVPDAYAAWGPGALSAALRLHAASPFDAVVATGFPWTSLLVARDFSARTGVPWLADFRDPWSGDAVFASDGLPDAVPLERQVLRLAARVIAVTEPLAAHLRRAGGADGAPVTVIPNGWDEDDFAHAVAGPRATDGRVRVSYIGVWKGSYGPAGLYDALEVLRERDPAALARLDVVMAGFTPGEAARRGLTGLVRELGPVPHGEALALMQAADLLFLTVAGSIHADVQVPGKLYEYLAAGAPILGELAPAGAAARLLDELHGGVTVAPGDIAGLAGWLARVGHDGTAALPRASRASLASYERGALTARLAAVLDGVVSTNVQ